jgi:hypothetical protein
VQPQLEVFSMSSVFELLQAMRGRVPMYVGSTGIVKLAGFMWGFQHALEQYGVHDTFLAEFQLLVQNRYAVKISKGWEEIIRFYSTDDNEAMATFWQLFDEYTSQRAA